MFKKITKKIAIMAGASIPILSLVLVMSSIAWALSQGTGVVLQNGEIGLEGTTSGSIAATTTNAAANLMGTTADYDLFYGSSTGTAISVLGKGGANQVLKMNAGATAFTWAADDAGGAGSNPILSLTSETTVELSAAASTFMGLGGRLGTFAQTGAPVGAYTFTNLYCVTSAAPNTTNGTSVLSATLVYGTCGPSAPSSSTTVALSDVDETAKLDAGEQAVSLGDCIGLKIAVATAASDPVFVNCTLERKAS